MLISHIISLSFYHFSTRFPLTKSFNSYSPQKQPTTWHQGISAQMKKQTPQQDLTITAVIWPWKENLAHQSCWVLQDDPWQCKNGNHPSFLGKNKHIRHAFWQSSTTRTENHGMPVLELQNKDSTRWRWNLSQGCQKNMKWYLSLTQTYLGLTKFKTKKTSSSRSPLMKRFQKSWHSFQIIPFPLIIGSGRLAKFKWWLHMQEAEDPIGIRSTSAQPPTSKIAIWNAHLVITISTKKFVILDHLMFFLELFGKILFVENKTLQVRFCRMLPAASRKVGGTEGHLRQSSAYLRSGPSGVKSRGKFSSVAPLKKALMVGLI